MYHGRQLTAIDRRVCVFHNCGCARLAPKEDWTERVRRAEIERVRRGGVLLEELGGGYLFVQEEKNNR